MKIYISGKISGLSEEEYTNNFDKATIDLLNNFETISEALLNIINPLNIKPFLGIKSWLTYMIADVLELRQCTHIAMQSNWTDSRGAIVEYYFSKFIFKQKIIWL